MRSVKENCLKIAGFVEERGGHSTPIQFAGSPGIYQYHNGNIPVIEMNNWNSSPNSTNQDSDV